MISLAYSLPVGIFEVWDIGLDVILNAINIDQVGYKFSGGQIQDICASLNVHASSWLLVL